jgi:murein DD-endopeptidase MepM/ murein hydrolase activator NlpD
VVLKPGAVNELYAWDEAPVGPFRVEVRRPGAKQALVSVAGFAVDKPLAVLGQGNRPLKWSAALVAFDALEGPGPVAVRFLSPGGKVLHEVSSEIAPRNFPAEDIVLDKTMSQLREKPDPRKDREAQAIWAIYLRFNGRSPWPGTKFLLPVDPSFPTSAQFGDIRNYKYVDGTQSRDYHTGIDFAVPVGTPVRAPAPGKVVLAADRMLTGTTLVIEHAPGVYSVYFHLSRALVSVGKAVQAGDKIALSGATGLVTGPHLHWEVRSGSFPVDPLDLTTDGLLDTKAAGAVISSVDHP